jgi:hypothetical protein
MTAPNGTLFLPLADRVRWHRVTQSEGHELHGVRLLPVRELSSVFLNFLERIEIFAHDSMAR